MTTMRMDIGLYPAKFWLRKQLEHLPGISGLSPNAVSMAALVPGLATAICLQQGLWLAAAVAIAGRMVCNTLDGLVAERYGKATKLGAYVNRLPNEITDLLIVIALSSYAVPPVGMALVALTGLVQTLGLLGLVSGGAVQSVGPCGQTDRLAIIGVACLLAATGLHVWQYAIPAMCLGLVVTAALRIHRSLTEIAAAQ